ncbi:MAG: sigma 54-interacting transcriptional regulator, partial [Pseudomonadota bacterium]
MILKVAGAEQNTSEKTILENIYRSWSMDRDRPTDEYICVVDQNSNLILHSANPETVGNYTGKNPIFNDTPGWEKNLSDLVKSQKDYVGSYVSSKGLDQIAAFVPVPGRAWTMGVHRSTSILKKEIQEGFRPFILGFLLVCGLLMPITLFSLFRTYSTVQKKQLEYSTALKESEYRYQSLVDAMPQGLYRTDLSGKITFANKAQLETLHFSLEECCGKTAFDLYPEAAARKSLADDIKVVRSGKNLHAIEKHESLKNNESVYIETIKSPVFNAKGEIVGIQGISWDITDKKLAEEKLHHTKAHLEALLHSVPSGIIAVDTEARLTMINQKAQEILGVRADNHLNKPVTEMIPDSHLTKIIFKNISEIGRTYRWGEKTLMVSRSPIYDGDKMIGGVSVFLDQSELEAVQNQLESLQILNDEFSSLVESSYDGVLTTDDEKVVKVNASYCRITGLSAASIEGKNISELDAEKHVCLAVVQELFRQVRRHRRSLTLQRRLNSGNQIVVTGCPVVDSCGDVRRVVMNIRDVTELMCHEDQYEGVCREMNTGFQEKMSLHGHIIAESPAMRNLLDLCKRVGQVDSTVLLTGETGVGKDVLSRVIHAASRRKDKPFVSINCGAIPENLLESEFFGYEKGAFTGATKEGKPGLFEQANGGIVFLDEVGELPLSLQVKLLKVIQDQQCRRLGGVKNIQLDTRVLAATNRDLKEMVKSGAFREDLFYRLYVVP